MAGLSRYYRSADPSINPTMQSATGWFWFLTSSCFRLTGRKNLRKVVEAGSGSFSFASRLVVVECFYLLRLLITTPILFAIVLVPRKLRPM